VGLDLVLCGLALVGALAGGRARAPRAVAPLP